jgi:hypothetical protein
MFVKTTVESSQNNSALKNPITSTNSTTKFWASRHLHGAKPNWRQLSMNEDDVVDVYMAIDKEGKVKLWTKDFAKGIQNGRELPPGSYKIRINEVLEVMYHDE